MNLSLACTALLLHSVLPSSSAAQESAPLFRLPEIRKGKGLDRPVLHLTYDVQREKITSTRTVSPGEIGLTSPPCFDNSAIIPDAYVVANPGEEVLNWGLKSCAGASRLRSFTILYLSEAVDPSRGGPGGTLSVALYSGTQGFGRPGTEIFRRTLTGLPASRVVQPTVFVTFDFGSEPLPLPDGRIGWGFLQLDGDTGPVLVNAPRPALGTLDAMDIYSPGPASAASYVGTFHYPFCSCANTFIQLDEIATDELASSTVLNGSGANPSLLAEILPARIGHVWAARVAVVSPPPGNPPFTALFLSAAAIAPISSPIGEILIDPAQRISGSQIAEGSYAFSIPADPALVGREVFVQAAVLRPVAARPFLTNALAVRIGF